jgi:hypothetical protein
MKSTLILTRVLQRETTLLYWIVKDLKPEGTRFPPIVTSPRQDVKSSSAAANTANRISTSDFPATTFKTDAGSRKRLLCMSRTFGSPLWAPKLPRYRTTSRPSQLDQWSGALNMGQSASRDTQTGANGEPERRFLGTCLELSLAYNLQL